MAKKKISKLTISGFRGARYPTPLNFTSNFNSMLVYGANAKGKSSLGDAIEWFFTGKIEELTKEGCSREDYRHRLLGSTDDTKASIEFSDPALNSDLVLTASLRQGHSNDTPQFDAFLEASKDELLILRHRDLKQFVQETKSYKRKRIAKLIGMEGWERIRDEMLAVQNRLFETLNDQRSSRDRRQREVEKLTGTEQFSERACWNFAEQQAKVLGIGGKIDSLDALRRADEAAKAAKPVTEREALLARLKQAEKLLKAIETDPPETASLTSFSQMYNQFCSSPEKVLWAQLSELYDKGKSILQSGYWNKDLCPLCGLQIPQEELVDHILEHEQKGEKLEEEIKALESARRHAKKGLNAIGSTISKINELDAEGIEELEPVRTSGSEVALKLADAKVFTEKAIETHAAIDISELGLEENLGTLLQNARDTSQSIETKINDLTPTDAERARIEAFQNINALSIHMVALVEIAERVQQLGIQHSSMEAFTGAFQDLRRRTMGDVLNAISGDVASYFLQLHPDEGFDDIQLKFLPEVDGVEFHIYYKGEEITPPRKFLSESYLSGLGVCLFLATVRAFNRENGFILLDDIVNSFDAEHRADLARLLVSEFGDLQLIVLTHDGVWFDLFRRLTQSGWQHRRINAWSYEDGLDIEQAPKDALGDCEQAIDTGRVEYAAPRVRSYMENRLKSLAFEVGVRMRFKPGSQNDERTTGELLADLRSYLKEREFFERADVTPFNELGASTFVANYGSHDRSMSPQAAGLTMGDIKFALERMKDLEALFSCQSCGKPMWTVRDRDFTMNCKCGELGI